MLHDVPIIGEIICDGRKILIGCPKGGTLADAAARFAITLHQSMHGFQERPHTNTNEIAKLPAEEVQR